MKYFLVVLAALVPCALAGNTAYGPPSQEAYQPIGSAPEQYTPQVFRHVYVHVGEDEPEERQSRVIRVPDNGDKHVNIVFIKAPLQSSQSNTEIVLPNQDEHKNLVYVLLKKQENKNDVKIRRPQAQLPTKPEVYFIRYKGQEQQQGGYQSNGAPAAIAQAPLPVVRTPSSTYGTPF